MGTGKGALQETSKALRYLIKRGWPIEEIRQTVKDTGLSIVEIAERVSWLMDGEVAE